MFSTSQDILYLVISFCIIWVTVFLCWMLYYVMRLLRNTNKIVEEFRSKLNVLTDTLNYIRGKVEHISGIMTLASGGVGDLVKKVVSNKAKQWIDRSTDDFDEAAKDAVDKAVSATATKMKKVARRIRR